MKFTVEFITDSHGTSVKVEQYLGLKMLDDSRVLLDDSNIKLDDFNQSWIVLKENPRCEVSEKFARESKLFKDTIDIDIVVEPRLLDEFYAMSYHKRAPQDIHCEFEGDHDSMVAAWRAAGYPKVWKKGSIAKKKGSKR